MSKVESGKGFKFMLLAAAGLLLPLLISLGFWQLERADEKRALLDSWQQSTPASVLPDDLQLSAAQYQTVALQGYFDTERYFLLDNRTRKGKAGFEVVAVFKPSDQGRNVLVNLGWVAAPNREWLPPVSIPSGLISIEGGVRQLEQTFVLGSDIEQRAWPRIIQRVDQAEIEQQLGFQVVPALIHLGQPLISGLDIDWSWTLMLPEKHQAYAAQWFCMAAALAVLLWLGLRKLREERYE